MNKSKDEIQSEALKAIGDKNRSCAAISMGVGKTKLGIMWLAKHYTDHVKILIVVPKLSIIDSWKEDMVKFKYEYLLSHVTFTTYLSLTKQDLNYDLLIADEIHNIKDSHRDYLSQYTGKILALTGTPPKYETSERSKIIDEFCPIVYRYITDDAVEDGILNDYRIIVHPIELSIANTMQMKTKSGKQWMTSEKKNYDYWTQRLAAASSVKERQIMSIMRMKSLMDFPSKAIKAKQLFNSIEDKVILFCNTQNQADSMSTHSYHSENPFSEDNLEMFKLGTIKKLSAVLQLSEGVNIPNLKSGIIMHCYGASSPKGLQRFARLLRLNPNDICILHVLMYENTIDKKWVGDTLSSLNQDKITWL